MVLMVSCETMQIPLKQSVTILQCNLENLLMKVISCICCMHWDMLAVLSRNTHTHTHTHTQTKGESDEFFLLSVPACVCE